MTSSIPLSIIGSLKSDAENPEQVFEACYRAKDPIITDHRMYGIVVVPGSLHLARLLYVIYNILNKPAVIVTEITFAQPLILPEDVARTVKLIISKDGGDSYSFQVVSARLQTSGSPETNWITHAAGHFIAGTLATIDLTSVSNSDKLLQQIKSRCKHELAISNFDKYFVNNELKYGPAYKWVEKIQYGDGEALSYMRAPTFEGETDWITLQAGQIDCSFQAFLGIIHDKVISANEKMAWVWAAATRLKFYAPPQGKLSCYNIIANYQEFNSDSKKATGNITLFDAQDQMVAEFEGIVVAKASQERIHKFLQNLNT